jgi:ferrous iron transport protein A
MTLDQLPIGKRARIIAVDWSCLVDEEAQRLRALGLDTGARVAVAHRGVFAGKDPLAIIVGRMTVALRRIHAAAMQVEPAADAEAAS